GSRYVTTIGCKHAVIGGQVQSIAGSGLQPVNHFLAGGKDAVYEVRFSVGTDSKNRLPYEIGDALWTVRAGYESITSNARVSRIDAIVVRARMPLLQRVVILNAVIGALPSCKRDLLP